MKRNDISSSSLITFLLIDYYRVNGGWVLKTVHFHISKNLRVVHTAKLILTHAITFHGIAGKRGASSLI
jgi:SNF family Na+-dependent transporter